MKISFRFNIENHNSPNIVSFDNSTMSNNDKETEKKWKKLEQEEMKEEAHQLELKENYEQDEDYEESEE